MCVFEAFQKGEEGMWQVEECVWILCHACVGWKGMDPDPELREYLGVSWPLVMRGSVQDTELGNIC